MNKKTTAIIASLGILGGAAGGFYAGTEYQKAKDIAILEQKMIPDPAATGYNAIDQLIKGIHDNTCPGDINNKLREAQYEISTR